MNNFDWQKFWEEHPLQNRDKVNEANVRPADYDYKKTLEYVAHTLDLDKDDELLDVGCGTGELTALLAPHVKLAVGADFSASMVELARERHTLPNTMFVKQAAHNITFWDGRFDKVISIGMIQNVPYNFFKQTIYELLRVTAPTGKLLIGDVLETAPPEAQVFVYPKEYWLKEFAEYNPKFLQSSFEKRIDVLFEGVSS